MSLIEKLLKNSTIKETAVLSKSKVFGNKPEIVTDVPMINAALSTYIDGGLHPGLFTLAAPSKHFKTAFALMFAGEFLKKYDDGVILFYDSEFGSPESYYDSFGVDKERVIHTPITNVEDLKFDITIQLQNIDKKDHVFILIDSVGNLASKKEVEDAIDQKSVADMTRAKQFKSLYRIITPHLNLKDVWCIAVNHVYKEQCLDGDTLIKTSEGAKPIRDICVGDHVYALNGLQEVTHTYGPDELLGEGKKYLELEFDDGTIVKCTHDHKFLMKDKTWSQAIDIKIGDCFY